MSVYRGKRGKWDPKPARQSAIAVIKTRFPGAEVQRTRGKGARWRAKIVFKFPMSTSAIAAALDGTPWKKIETKGGRVHMTAITRRTKRQRSTALPLGFAQNDPRLMGAEAIYALLKDVRDYRPEIDEEEDEPSSASIKRAITTRQKKGKRRVKKTRSRKRR